MKNVWKIILILVASNIIMLNLSLGLAQTEDKLPKGWAIYSSQKIGIEALECARYSQDEWRVFQNRNEIQISKNDQNNQRKDLLPFKIKPDNKKGLIGERHVIKIEDGWLIGFDAGEFGGSLWWFNDNGTESYKLSSEHVVGFATLSNKVLVLSGFAHIIFDEGKVLIVEKNQEGKWQANTFVDVGSAVNAYANDGLESLLILTSTRLLRLDNRGRLQRLYATQYSGLYPNSMILTNTGVIYIGMRHFVTKLKPFKNSFIEEWLVPKGCLTFKTKDSGCVCYN